MAIIRNYINSIFDNDPKEAVGIDGFESFVRIKEKYSYENNVPTTYLEDGSYINDHIIRQPITIAIEGNVSDIYLKPSTPINLFRRAESEIGTISQYLPNRTTAQTNKVLSIISDVTNAVDEIDAIIDKGASLSKYIGLIGKGISNGQKFIDNMQSIYNTDRLVQIDMPYKTFKNMRITMLEINKDNENNAIDYVLEAQEVKFADTITAEVSPVPAMALKGSTEGITEKGLQEGVKVSQSTLSLAKEKLKGA